MIHCVRTFSIMHAYGVRLIVTGIEEVRNYGKIVYFFIFENGWWEDAYPLSYPPGHNLQKPSKKSGMFQSLGTINFVFFLLKAESKEGWAWHNDSRTNGSRTIISLT